MISADVVEPLTDLYTWTVQQSAGDPRLLKGRIWVSIPDHLEDAFYTKMGRLLRGVEIDRQNGTAEVDFGGVSLTTHRFGVEEGQGEGEFVIVFPDDLQAVVVERPLTRVPHAPLDTTRPQPPPPLAESPPRRRPRTALIVAAISLAASLVASAVIVGGAYIVRRTRS